MHLGDAAGDWRSDGFVILPGYLPADVLRPAKAADFQRLEMFVYLVDVPGDLDPPHLVPKADTAHIEAKPNWLSRQASTGTAPDRQARSWLSSQARSTAVPA